MHRNFPGQFRYIAPVYSRDKNNNVVFVTNNPETPTYAGIKKVVYKIKRRIPKDSHRYLRFYEDSVIHGQSAAEELINLQQAGFKPDVIIGHSWGSSLFVKEIFPDTPYIAYMEWYYNYKDSDVDFAKKEVDINEKASLMCKNAHLLQDLVSCDYAISPTNWQKSQFPDIFKDKITVIHEGINTEICCPNDNARFKIPDKDIVLTKDDEVLTYVTRGMEEYRGFPEFMKAASILMKQRPNLHIVVGGEDRVCYGRTLANTTFKKEMLKKYNYDMNRLHFVGLLKYNDYVNLLQTTTAHVYLTYPFVLSWSLMEAMAIGCRIIASNTQPVKEVIKDGFSGILTDFFDTDTLVKKINEVLDNKESYSLIQKNARDTIIKKYDQKDMIKKQFEFINNCVKNYSK